MHSGLGLNTAILSVLLAVLALGRFPCPGARLYQPAWGDPMLEPWRWHTFPELSGLGAQCVAEGADGTMWFGTAEGIWSYDGIHWEHHSTKEGVGGNTGTLCRGGDGTVCAGGRAGICQFSGGKWTGLFPPPGQSFGEIRKLALAHDGSLWAATAWGALRCQQSRWTLYTGLEIAARLQSNPSRLSARIAVLPETVLAKARTNALPTIRFDFTEVCADRQGRIWLGTEGGEVLCYDPSPAPASSNAMPAAAAGQWSIYNESDGLGGGRSPSILQLQNGAIWVVYAVSAAGCVDMFDEGSWKKLRLAEAGLPAEGGPLIQTRDGVVWLSARYVLGAYRDGQWRTYEKPEVPIPTARNFLLQSADGALWIAGPSTEIQRVDYQTPRWLTLPDLNFQWESPAGVQWFLHRDGRVVARDTNQWTSYGVEDGLMDAPVALLGTRNGDLWATGSHEQTAATARFDGRTWTRFIHDDLSWGVDWRAALESSEESVWFGAAVDSAAPKKHLAGLMQFRRGEWVHHHQPKGSAPEGGGENLATLLPPTRRPEPVGKFLCLGESRDGRIWAGRNLLAFYDEHQWRVFAAPPSVRLGVIETMFTSRERDLWIGTRQFGAVRYDGHVWQPFQGKDSLVANSVRSLTQTADGSVWAATDRGVSRFDGRTWTADLLPAQLNVPHEGGSLKGSASGSLWINRFAPEWTRRAWSKAPPVDTAHCEFWTMRYQFEGAPPQTTLNAGAERVSPPGNLSVFWSGVVPWRVGDDSRLQFSFRLDDQPWSVFTSERGHSFFTLPSGRHHLEVRARDRDFNLDPTPATLDFVVLPPVWRQDWFLLLMILLTGLIATQSARVVQERRRLRTTNRLLAAEIEERQRAETALRRLNLELDQRVTERTAQLQAANRELEAFAYSVSHDLRAPLRGIDGFSQALLDDCSAKLDEQGKRHLHRVRAAAQRMAQLIDDLLSLARVTRSELRLEQVNLSSLAQEIAAELARREPKRQVLLAIAPEVVVRGDSRFLRIALENLLGNAWKFTSQRQAAQIEFGATEREGRPVYFVRDNGAGFDMNCVGRLFGAFQRLHAPEAFPGTGIGLATVQRIIHRHGGRVWAEGRVNQGATFYFALR